MKLENAPGLDFHDTGVTLVTDKRVPGIPSISSEQSMKECRGIGLVAGASRMPPYPPILAAFGLCFAAEREGMGWTR